MSWFLFKNYKNPIFALYKRDGSLYYTNGIDQSGKNISKLYNITKYENDVETTVLYKYFVSYPKYHNYINFIWIQLLLNKDDEDIVNIYKGLVEYIKKVKNWDIYYKKLLR